MALSRFFSFFSLIFLTLLFSSQYQLLFTVFNYISPVILFITIFVPLFLCDGFVSFTFLFSIKYYNSEFELLDSMGRVDYFKRFAKINCIFQSIFVIVLINLNMHCYERKAPSEIVTICPIDLRVLCFTERGSSVFNSSFPSPPTTVRTYFSD